MELLVNLKALMRETPIPYFINATVLRLLEVFRHNDSALRRFIVQIMGECSDELRVVYSKAEIIRRLMRISYSNDSLTRAFNLRLLATLSAVISDNKRVSFSDIVLLMVCFEFIRDAKNCFESQANASYPLVTGRDV
uniref:Integrator complex subunit 7 n=1 Tax=Parascaris equorum TaxID=6256 RepID=A0A914RDQ7_PAREQ